MSDLEEHYRVYNDDYYEVAITSKNAVIHDKSSNKYYGTRSTSVPTEIARLSQERSSVFSVKVSLFGTASMVVLLIINMIFSMRSSTVVTPHFFLWFVPYMIFSVTLHEGAHVMALRICGRKPDKIGFKMNYLIFPAFYVRMNQILLLPVSDKVLVHIAGIWTNLATNLFLFLLNAMWVRSSDLGHSLAFAVLTLSVNALPVLNSDGYRCLLAWADVNEHIDSRRNPPWVFGLRILSWIIVVVYIVRFLLNYVIW